MPEVMPAISQLSSPKGHPQIHGALMNEPRTTYNRHLPAKASGLQYLEPRMMPKPFQDPQKVWVKLSSLKGFHPLLQAAS